MLKWGKKLQNRNEEKGDPPCCQARMQRLLGFSMRSTLLRKHVFVSLLESVSMFLNPILDRSPYGLIHFANH